MKNILKQQIIPKEALDFFRDLVASDFMDGVFFFLSNKSYEITLCYTENVDGNDQCVAKVANFGNGMLSLISLPKSEPLMVFGPIDFESLDVYSTLFNAVTELNEAYEYDEDDECSEEIAPLAALMSALEEKETLEFFGHKFMDHFQEYDNYFLELSEEVLPGMYDLSDQGYEEKLSEFIRFLDKTVRPKLEF